MSATGTSIRFIHRRLIATSIMKTSSMLMGPFEVANRPVFGCSLEELGVRVPFQFSLSSRTAEGLEHVLPLPIAKRESLPGYFSRNFRVGETPPCCVPPPPRLLRSIRQVFVVGLWQPWRRLHE